jgi:periplasmic protein TonB
MGYQALLFCPDEKTARNVTHVLKDLDFSVEPCSEPFAAVKKLMAQHFDAVVVDCDNEQNATLLFKSARNSSSNQSSLAVAVVEGQAGVAKAFRIGANLVLTKPINVEQAKGTLRVARGLLRKGGEAPKNAPAGAVAPPSPTTTKPAAPKAGTGSVTASPSVATAPPARTTAAPISAPKHIAPARPAMSASALGAEIEDQDTILEDDDPGSRAPAPAFEAQATANPPAPAGGSKFPWQPSPKMAEPMASALRRAAEAAGQVEPAEEIPSTPAVAPPPPAEKRITTGAMFQAQGHAAAPALAADKPSSVVAERKIQEPLTISKTVVREAPEARAERPVFDTTSNVAPPTFFPGAYDSDEVEGGGKTKAIVIVAAVVLLACSAGYLSWKNGNKNSAPPATTQTANPPSPASQAVEANNSPESKPSAAQPASEEIRLGNSSAAPATPAPRETASNKPSPKQPAPEPASEPEPEVTQRLIVRSDTGHKPSEAKAQEPEPVQAPSAIGMGASTDTKALASISSAPVNVPKPSPQMLRVSQGVMEGLVLKRVQPRYPTQALQMRIQGSVELQATVSKTGDIQNLKVIRGDAVLARAAQDAVKQWKYKPYYLNGDPVQIETQILVNFRLPN